MKVLKLNQNKRGFSLTSTGFAVALLCVLIGGGYRFVCLVDHDPHVDRYAQRWVTGSLATAQELRDDPLLQSRAVHSMLWVYKLE